MSAADNSNLKSNLNDTAKFSPREPDNIAPLREFGAANRARLEGLCSSAILFICAGNGEDFDFATSVGVGLVNSAINLTRLLERAQTLPSEIIFVGTCGLYDNSNLKVLDVFETTFAANVEISQLLGLAYAPLFSPDVSRETLPVNCSNFITTDKAASAKFASLGFAAENMEFFSVREVANAYRISARAVLCATNYCDKNAHADFLANRASAKIRLEAYLKERKFL